MEEIQRQVRRANRRLTLTRAISTTTWALFCSLLVALAAVAVSKFWPIGVESRIWALAWIGGALVVGLAAGIALAMAKGRGAIDAAIEIDLRYGLKERVSSALALSPVEQETEAGRALMEDAERRIGRIDVREHFRPQWNWHPLLPVVTAILVFLVAFLLTDAERDQASAANKVAASKQIRKSVEELRKKLEEQRKKAKATGLKDADELIAKYQKAVDDLSQKDMDRKKTLIKLNNLSRELAERRKDTAGSEKTRNQLKQLKNIQQGPADRIAKALKKGDMNQAMQELKKLSNKLRSEELSEEEKQQLVKQLQQLEKELAKMLQGREKLMQKKQDLQKKIDELKQQGDQAAAGDLQKKLDQVQNQLDEMDKQAPQLQKLQDLAGQLGQCAECVKNGDGKQAARQLDQITQSLQQMQGDLNRLKTLNEMMQEIADTKSAMNCKSCNGKGCDECRGASMAMSDGNRFSEQPGTGMGPGRGMGDRPEEETETGGYRARVDGQPRQGEAVRVGDADGPNVAGNSREAINKEYASSVNKDSDPVRHLHLPRREREQAKEYFDALRKGN